MSLAKLADSDLFSCASRIGAGTDQPLRRGCGCHSISVLRLIIWMSMKDRCWRAGSNWSWRARSRDTDRAGAITWAKAALAGFERIGAAHDADETNQLLREMGASVKSNARSQAATPHDARRGSPGTAFAWVEQSRDRLPARRQRQDGRASCESGFGKTGIAKSRRSCGLLLVSQPEQKIRGVNRGHHRCACKPVAVS